MLEFVRAALPSSPQPLPLHVLVTGGRAVALKIPITMAAQQCGFTIAAMRELSHPSQWDGPRAAGLVRWLGLGRTAADEVARIASQLFKTSSRHGTALALAAWSNKHKTLLWEAAELAHREEQSRKDLVKVR